MVELIAFTGAQGTGKSTMRTELVKVLNDNGYSTVSNYINVKDSISRDAAKFGFPINLEANFESQYYIVMQYIVADLKTRKFAEKNNIDYIVVDRSIIDVLSYAKMCIKVDAKYLILRDIVERHIDMFTPDYLVYCSILDILVKDEFRSDDKKYQKTINDSMSANADYFNAIKSNLKLYNLKSDTVENRLNFLLDKLDIKIV